MVGLNVVEFVFYWVFLLVSLLIVLHTLTLFVMRSLSFKLKALKEKNCKKKCRIGWDGSNFACYSILAA